VREDERRLSQRTPLCTIRYIRRPGPRPPRPSFPFRRNTFEGRASLGQSRLSTSAMRQYSVRAHPRDRLRVRREMPCPLRGLSVPKRLPITNTSFGFPRTVCAVGNAPCEAPPKRVCSGCRLRLSTAPAKVQPRADCPEAKGSQPFGHFASSPPSKAAEHPSVTSLLPRMPEVRPPRLARSIAPSFPGGEGPRLASHAGLGPHSTARPRRLTMCAKTRVLSTDRPERVRRSPSLRARSVSPSRRPEGALRS